MKKIKEKITWWDKKSLEEKQKILERKKKTNLKKYGVENYTNTEKKKQTNLKKYGVEHPLQRPEIQEKMKETNLERYGVKYYNNPEKRRQTNLERYGTETLFQNKETQEKRRQTNLEKYGVGSSFQRLEIQEKMKKTYLENYYKKLFNSNRLKNLIIPLFPLEEYKGTKREKYKFQCIKCKNVFEDDLADGRIPRCFKCYSISTFTKPHKMICEYLEKKNIKLKIEKYINPYFVDIFIEPDKIIEVYGDYWHGNPKFYKEGEILDLPSGKISIKEKWEKDEKRIKCLEKKGNKVLILWEDEINSDFGSIKKKIKEFFEDNNY